MILGDFIPTIESEWEPETGFFWRIRQGHFRKEDFERVLAKFLAVPSVAAPMVPLRLVSTLWYVPIFMHWQCDRVREQGSDLAQYEVAMTKLTNEVERILGVP